MLIMQRGGVRERLHRPRRIAHAPEGTGHVSYNPMTAPEHAGKHKRALAPSPVTAPHARRYARLAALMQLWVCGSGSTAPGAVCARQRAPAMCHTTP